ncbi:heavy-metal-associated domain-containing protein [Candidatus Saccharibacteria bacterium]|nr:heavy-metal-associated domain-containing protein [Candidatus Saccharibacteria bacterium]
MATQQFELKNISCSSCVIHLEGMEDDLDGIEKIDVNFKKQMMKVDYDQDKITPDHIVSAVTKMGYGAIPVETTDKKGSSWSRLFRS